MHLSVLVIKDHVFLQTVLDQFVGDLDGFVFAEAGIGGLGPDHHIQGVEQFTGIPSGILQHGFVFPDLYLEFLQVRVLGQGALEQFLQVSLGEGIQNVNLTAGEQGRDHLEGGVLGGGPDQGHDALFHCSQQRILLCFGETVNLINEKHRIGFVEKLVLFCLLNGLPYILHSGLYGAQSIEGTVHLPGDDGGQCGFPHARGAP